MTKEITNKSYAKLLSEVKNHITRTQNNIAEIVARQKVEMAWLIGRSIYQHLLQNNQSGYGRGLFENLEKDIGIAQAALYKMHNFYKAYPKIPQDDSKLNWSHYRALASIKGNEERKHLEDLVRENSWNVLKLESEVKKSRISIIKESKISKIKEAKPAKLKVKRGKLFSYKLTKFTGSNKIYIDCGFNIFKEVEEVLSTSLAKELKNKDQIVTVKKDGENYSFQKLEANPRELHTYKAYLEEVIDGDTIHVILDLGFKIFHREILRLAQIDAPELKTVAGKKSSDALKRILKNTPFLIIRTNKIDIYGRYVADVFLGDSEKEVQKIADEGIYLNQFLLDKKLALPFS